MSDIFVSYASEDRSRIRPIVDALQQQGWSIWWDRTILAGKTFDQVIEAALAEARCVIVLWSRNSITSDWVWTEADEGKRRGILVPALLDQVTIPFAFRRIHAASLIEWRGTLPSSEFDELVRGVSAVLSTAAPPGATAPATATVPGAATATHEKEHVGDPLPKPGEGRVRENPKDGLRYVWIPPGSFRMGCSAGDSECFPDESPPHDVKISKGFWLGQTEVTQAAWKKVMGGDPSDFKGDQLPVETVSWFDAVKYCEAIGGRLPTEAEWEYAARAGSNSARYGESDAIAWYDKNSGDSTHPVGGKQPNQFGLFDMLGNVWEWVQDDYAPYQAGPVVDPQVVIKGSNRKGKVVRGGSWFSDSQVVRASGRIRYVPSLRGGFIGFRCVGEFR